MLTLLLVSGLFGGQRAPLRVDINPPINRSDLVTRDWENWTVSDTSRSRDFGGVVVTFKSASPVRGLLFKPNLVYGASMASDGVLFEDAVDMVITGLAPGRHTLVTYHNQLENTPTSRYEVRVDGVPKVAGLRPSTKAHGETDVAYAYLDFEAADRPVVISFRADKSGKNNGVILNGFEIDTSDPRSKAIKPDPPHLDEHADADSGTLKLRWTAPANAVSHDVYFGTDRSAVEGADRTSPLYRGNRATAVDTVKGLAYTRTYYWRVDEVGPDGRVVKGDSWSFRVRHLAFPGAEGYGRFARGGRGGRVIEVTNLEDSGPGSFRDAVDAAGPRTVIFRVSGVIDLKSPISIRPNDLTVAGQTAPGDGICFRGQPVGTSSGSSDIIIRHVRVRVGDEARRSYDGIGLGGAHTIFDHCSVSWSIDE